ncbi:magnesium-dependent phosphatase-1 [Aphanomyces invadans]|uniref:Magnesium-dependent phosphatase-1 n=1 Tax=Aphanomyces invadans TaxID=157072 RepID=A0A024U5F5_9STRA|nr:magnesium-dependent phosphatase-1 [Aphanomyces invadans]ETW00843.1 magnesium-dependent phosphatase-1 [Aphanomyces invadans]|eukprot:XP_008870978.1 magnesium-dependent phosphatase-1 [Aphanomyces invadans]
MATTATRPWTRVPKLIVFDLDFTLWYPEMYELAGAPFRRSAKGVVTARDGEEVHLFDAVHPVLQEIAFGTEFAETCVAVASRTTYPEWACECMDLILVQFKALSTSEKTMQRRKGLNSKCETLANLVQYQAIYPTNKRVHFKQLADDSGVAFSDMLFFDNEYSNIRDISAIGVTSIYCPDGLTWDVWEQGMAAFQCK